MSLTEEQTPWLMLLNEGRMPESDPANKPGAWMIQDDWQQILQQSIQSDDGGHWLSWLHLGVMHFNNRRFDEAKLAWQKSLSLKSSAWALRNLAMSEMQAKNFGAAANLLEQAREILPTLVPLTVECIRALLEAKQPTEVLDLLKRLPEEIRGHGRVRILEARAAADLGDVQRADSILTDAQLEVADLREGEQLLSELWYALQIKKAQGTSERCAGRRATAMGTPPLPTPGTDRFPTGFFEGLSRCCRCLGQTDGKIPFPLFETIRQVIFELLTCSRVRFGKHRRSNRPT